MIWNFKRDVDPSVAGQVPHWTVREANPFTSPDPLTVAIHLAEPDAALVNGFPLDNANWIASPSAFKKMGEKEFRVKPVGAGPFVVVRGTAGGTC